MNENSNKTAHEAVLHLLFADILTTEEANKLHDKIDKKIKVSPTQTSSGPFSGLSMIERNSLTY